MITSGILEILLPIMASFVGLDMLMNAVGKRRICRISVKWRE